MKRQKIDKEGNITYVCGQCRKEVDYFDTCCEVCCQDLSTLSLFPIFEDSMDADKYYANHYKIMKINRLVQPLFGVCVFVMANPIKNIGGIRIAAQDTYPDETLNFLYPDIPKNKLTDSERFSLMMNSGFDYSKFNFENFDMIAKTSLLEINFDEFEMMTINIAYSRGQQGVPSVVYQHKSFDYYWG